MIRLGGIVYRARGEEHSPQKSSLAALILEYQRINSIVRIPYLGVKFPERIVILSIITDYIICFFQQCKAFSDYSFPLGLKACIDYSVIRTA